MERPLCSLPTTYLQHFWSSGCTSAATSESADHATGNPHKYLNICIYHRIAWWSGYQHTITNNSMAHMMGTNHLPGTETLCIRFATKGNGRADAFWVHFHHQSFISCSQPMKWGTAHQNRAYAAGSYYKGKPHPEDQAPQPLLMGNPCSILYSKLHTGMHKLLG